MVGDCNLYINGVFDEGEAEIEIMIAEQSARRKGIASVALRVMMTYANVELAVTRFIAKIKADNVPSRKLFQKLHFQPLPDDDDCDSLHDTDRAADNREPDESTLLGTPNCFGEVELL